MISFILVHDSYFSYNKSQIIKFVTLLEKTNFINIIYLDIYLHEFSRNIYNNKYKYIRIFNNSNPLPAISNSTPENIEKIQQYFKDNKIFKSNIRML